MLSIALPVLSAFLASAQDMPPLPPGLVAPTQVVWSIQYSINLKSTNWWSFNNMKFTNTLQSCHVGLSRTNYPIAIFFRAVR